MAGRTMKASVFIGRGRVVVRTYRVTRAEALPPPSVCERSDAQTYLTALALSHACAENIRIVPIVVAEPELGNIERKLCQRSPQPQSRRIVAALGSGKNFR